METNLIAAYKSLALVVGDPGFTALAAGQQQAIKDMMANIRAGLIQFAQQRAITQVDASLK